MLTGTLSPFCLGSKLGNFCIRQYRGGEGFFNSPSVFGDPSPKSSIGDANVLTPLRKRARFSVMTKNNVVGSIGHLQVFTCPSNVALFVMSVVVDSIEAHVLWAIPKMFKELKKVLKPHLNSASAIILKRIVRWIAAPVSSIEPSGVFAGPFHSVNFGHDGSIR